MTNHNLLRAIQDYSNLGYMQGEVVGSRTLTLKESREEIGIRRFMKFAEIVNILKQLAPTKIDKELNRGNYGD